MLTTILNSLPPSKCVLIEDTIILTGKPLLASIIKLHYDRKKFNIHYFAFESSPDSMKAQFPEHRFQIYDYFSDPNGWMNNKQVPLMDHKVDGIVIIDSLADLILEKGIVETYKIVNNFLHHAVQFITLLHEDILEDKINSLKYLEYLSTLILKLKLIRGTSVVDYTLKKSHGRTVRKLEEYHVTRYVLETKPFVITLPTYERVTSLSTESIPDSMATFKISLEDREKAARDKVVLPHVAKSLNQVGQTSGGGGNISYNFDEFDDWDEEDPDDDLYI